MRVYWESKGVLEPIYRLVGEGFDDRQIASKLNIPEAMVAGCVSWLLQSFAMPDRLDLIRHAFRSERAILSRASE